MARPLPQGKRTSSICIKIGSYTWCAKMSTNLGIPGQWQAYRWNGYPRNPGWLGTQMKIERSWRTEGMWGEEEFKDWGHSNTKSRLHTKAWEKKAKISHPTSEPRYHTLWATEPASSRAFPLPSSHPNELSNKAHLGWFSKNTSSVNTPVQKPSKALYCLKQWLTENNVIWSSPVRRGT